VSANDQFDFDRDSCDLATANKAAACVIRHLAAQLEAAGHHARTMRLSGMDPSARARAVDLALVSLAGAMSEHEVSGLVNALRHAATATQDDHVCEFCGTPTEPWSMLMCDSRDDGEIGGLVHHAWDQYGYTLCKHCHLAVHRARWQAAAQM
jgi:hypothetical protein